MMQNTDVYRCYSNCLKNYLAENGVKYILVAKDIKSNRVFYAFEKTKLFIRLLQQWEGNNPNNK